MSWKKTAIVLAIFVLVIGGPVFLISTPMMDVYQEWIDKDPKTDFHKSLQLWIAGVCFRTMRADSAVDMYYKYLTYYPDSPDRAFALLRYAQSLDEVNRNAEAIATYEQFMAEFPGHDDAKTAEDAINSIKYVKAGTNK